MTLVTGGLLGPKIVTGGLGVTSTPTPTPTPGALALTGPTSGITGHASSNFTVTATNLPTSDNVIPASDSGGTFTPPARGFAAGSSTRTFTYTPSADGLHAISISDTIGATITGSPRGYTSTTPTPTPTPPGDLKIAIITALGADTEAVALFADRVFPVIIPQSSPAGAPTLTYQFNTSSHDTTLTAPAGMRYVEVLFRVSSFDVGEIETGREVLRDLLQGYRTTLAGVPIVYVFFEAESDGYDEPIAGSDTGIYWKEMPFTFKLRESMPTNATA